MPSPVRRMLAASLLAATSLTALGADPVPLVTEGQPIARIVVPARTEYAVYMAALEARLSEELRAAQPDAPEAKLTNLTAAAVRKETPKTGDEEALAAEELQTFIRKISGATLPIEAVEADAPLPPGPTIALGPGFARAAGYGAELDGLHRDGFLARAQGDRVYLSGQRARGTLYAAYELLESLGCRWVMPGEFGEIYPSTATLATAIDTLQNPDHEQRYWWCTYGNGAEYPRWTLRNKGNFVPAAGDPRIEQGHALAQPLRWGSRQAAYEPQPGAADANGKATPPVLPDEYYAMVAGAPSRHIPNMSNPKVWDLYAAYYAEQPGPYVSASIEDAIMNDDRPGTRALDSMEFDYLMGAMTGTDRLWFFYNRVLERLATTRPELKLGMLVYSNLMTPPRLEHLHRNMALVFAPLSVCPLHHVRDPKCKSNRSYAGWLAAWMAQARAAGAETYYYDYEPLGYCWNVAAISPRWAIIGKNYPWFHEMGLDGHTTQGYDDWASCHLDNWMMQRLYWNVDQDYKEIVADYCRIRFGAAAPAMLDYYTLLEARMDEVPDLTSNEMWGNHLVLTPEVRAACRAAITRAVALATTERDRAQVHTMVLLQRSTDAYFDGIEHARETGDFAAAADLMAPTFEVMEELNAIYSHFMNPDRVGPKHNAQFLTGGNYRHIRKIADTLAAARSAVVLPRTMKIALDTDNTAWTHGYQLPGADVSPLPDADSTLIPDITYGTQREVAAFFYRTEVEVPADFADSKKTLLYFPSLIAKAVQIWVDGKPISFDHGAYQDTTFRGPDYFWINYDHQVAFDLTPHIKPGTRQTLAFRVFKSFDHGGSYNRIYLLADPAIDATPSR